MNKGLGAMFAILAVAAPAAVRAADAELPVPMQKYESIRYYSAGVGRDERRQLPQLFPLRVVFVTDRNQALCEADVTISAQGKPVFRGRAEHGPWLFVDLPAGVYDIEAVQEGKARTAKGVRLGAGKKQTVVMKWKSAEVDQGL